MSSCSEGETKTSCKVEKKKRTPVWASWGGGMSSLESRCEETTCIPLADNMTMSVCVKKNENKKYKCIRRNLVHTASR